MNQIFMKTIIAKIKVLVLLLVLVSCVDTEKNEKDKLEEKDVKGIYEYSGHFIGGITWLDNNGENILIISKSDKFLGEIAINARKNHEFEIVNGDTSFYGIESEAFDQEIFAYNYVKQNDNLSLLWKMYDFEKDCVMNLIIQYLENPPLLTDLDNDNIMESWIIYKKTCTSDVSPLDLKIIMHEGNKKYALRGKNIVETGVDSYAGGEKEFDSNFKNGDQRFIGFAENIWEEHKNNTW